MNQLIGTVLVGLSLSAASTLIPQSVVCAQESTVIAQSTTLPKADVIQLRPDDVTAIIASSGTLRGNVKRHERSANVVQGFETPEDTVTWVVNAPQADDYLVSVLFSKKEPTNIEVSSGETALVAPSLTRTWDYRPFFWRQELPGVLHLKAGENRITLRLPDAKTITASQVDVARKSTRFGQGVTENFHLFSIELGTAEARQAQATRAKEIRSDASWMVDGKYGIFVHWSSLSRGFTDDQPRAKWFQKSVEMFDVKVFADAIERTGAAWVTFTATHQGFYWPGPNAALDRIAPGRTAERDLLGEIINELDQRGIRTLFYLHTGYNGYDPEVWREAVGAKESDGKRFSDNIEAILRECSLRYGDKLMGFGYIDGAQSWDYPLNPSWEGWARAIKAGNPNALVGFSFNRATTVSPFNDLFVTDGGSELLSPDPQLIGPGRQLGDVTTAWWCLMDREGWFPNKPFNGQHGQGPVHSTEEYVDFFERMAAAKIPVTINLIMTADVTDDHPIFNPKCMAVMDEVRKAIRRK
ncbi:alpha-L-fucosidase [Rhodopirellula sp. SWK7]|uniref:alpha-L-fucosidase n=1 Tax=Rhodopirellula sp. SWK7 TaxID=595460 RepID=UPI0002BF00A2|nr:alpha-L-fucosidase [Rhodopirellula sp. SWK7]EMI43324.1 putative secreted protein [Rhodopirellula sp. SWK7]